MLFLPVSPEPVFASLESLNQRKLHDLPLRASRVHFPNRDMRYEIAADWRERETSWRYVT